MPTQIRITAGRVQLEAKLNDSPTAKSVYLVSSERHRYSCWIRRAELLRKFIPKRIIRKRDRKCSQNKGKRKRAKTHIQLAKLFGWNSPDLIRHF